MKVLVYRYGSICEPDIIETFKTFGLEVTEYRHEMTVKDDKPSESVRLLSDFLNDHPADFVFSINFFPYVSEVCQIFHLRYVSWTVDSPVMELYSTSITNSYNRTFIFDRADYEEFHPYNPDCIFHLPLAANVKAQDRLFQGRFAHDVAFVGSLYSEKSPYRRAKHIPPETRGYLDGIMAAQQNVYGYYFLDELINDKVLSDFMSSIKGFYRYPADSYLTDAVTMSRLYLGNEVTARERQTTFKLLSENFPTYIYTGSDTSAMPRIHNMGLAKSLTEMPLIFHESRININTTSKVIRQGLPLRIFDILSCGGFCLTNYQTEIPELFMPGEDLVVYTSMEEMIYLCGYYLNHESERQAIARNGYEKLRDNYTYEKQMEKMLLTAFKH